MPIVKVVRLFVEVEVDMAKAHQEMTEAERNRRFPVQDWTRAQIKLRLKSMPAVQQVEAVYIPELLK